MTNNKLLKSSVGINNTISSHYNDSKYNVKSRQTCFFRKLL